MYKHLFIKIKQIFYNNFYDVFYRQYLHDWYKFECMAKASMIFIVYHKC